MIFRKSIVLVFLIVFLAGCGGSESATETPPEPTPTEVKVEPTSAPSESEDSGKQVFTTRCASCHYLSDLDQVGPGLAGLFALESLPNGEPFSGQALADFILNGGGAMPGQRLSQEELDALIAYLRDATQ
jgi:mono/diheme cytochrome c family protein